MQFSQTYRHFGRICINRLDGVAKDLTVTLLHAVCMMEYTDCNKITLPSKCRTVCRYTCVVVPSSADRRIAILSSDIKTPANDHPPNTSRTLTQNFTQIGPQKQKLPMEADLDPSKYCESHQISFHEANNNCSAVFFITCCKKFHSNLKKTINSAYKTC